VPGSELEAAWPAIEATLAAPEYRESTDREHRAASLSLSLVR